MKLQMKIILGLCAVIGLLLLEKCTRVPERKVVERTIIEKVEGKPDTITLVDTVVLGPKEVVKYMPSKPAEIKEDSTKVYKETFKDSTITILTEIEVKDNKIDSISFDYEVKTIDKVETIVRVDTVKIDKTETIVEEKKVYRNGLYGNVGTSIPLQNPLSQNVPFVGIHYQDKMGVMYGIDKGVITDDIFISVKFPLFHRR